ncbi:MAG: M15 family metallopeptidase [Spirochaetia bacterium]
MIASKKQYLPLLGLSFWLLAIACFSSSNLHANRSRNNIWLQHSIRDLPQKVASKILSNPQQFLKLINQLNRVSNSESLILLVDKLHPLAPEYIPKELINLSKRDWSNTTRADIFVSTQIIHNLKKMLESAAGDGVYLQIGSGYRDYTYQKKLFEYWSNKLGLAKARRLSAMAGSSQHQLGTTIDFYPINASFNDTHAQQWLARNASRYGFSLSYPLGHEKETGYTYESWHYRYLSPLGCQIQDEFFDGLQYLFLTWYAKYHY